MIDGGVGRLQSKRETVISLFPKFESFSCLNLGVLEPFIFLYIQYLTKTVWPLSYLCRIRPSVERINGDTLLSLKITGILTQNDYRLITPMINFALELNHDIEFLEKKYRKLYPGKRFEIRIPFKEDYAQLTTQQRKKIAVPQHQFHGYPVDKEGKEWTLLHTFEPISFLNEIKILKLDIERIRQEIKCSQPDRLE